MHPAIACDAAGATDVERDELVNDDVVVALLVWLGVLTITILATLVALCYHKIKVSNNFKLFTAACQESL